MTSFPENYNTTVFEIKYQKLQGPVMFCDVYMDLLANMAENVLQLPPSVGTGSRNVLYYDRVRCGDHEPDSDLYSIT